MLFTLIFAAYLYIFICTERYAIRICFYFILSRHIMQVQPLKRLCAHPAIDLEDKNIKDHAAALTNWERFSIINEYKNGSD